MSRRIFIASFLMALTLTSCYLPISGQVIDAETQRPIEGAVVLVEWRKTHGLGEHWTESAKVVEVISDKDGRVKISGCYDPSVQPPNVIVYKKGYVAWNNYYVFPGSEQRTDFEWKNGYVFKLNGFLNTYSYIKHWLFIAPLLPHINKKTLLEKEYYESERMKYWEEERGKDLGSELKK